MTFRIPRKAETERLILRIVLEEDWKDLHAFYSDQQCIEYTVQRVLNEAETWRMVAALIGHWHIRGYGPYTVTHRSTNQVMGLVGLWYPNDWPEPEIKWALIRTFWGSGYAFEAAQAVKKMSHHYLPDTSLISLIAKENEKSKNLAQRMGANVEKEIDFRDGKYCIYRHSVTEQND